MAISTAKRNTICVWDEAWQKYASLKRKYLLQYGRPEISFTEFANACILMSEITVSQLLEVKRKHSLLMLKKRLTEEEK